MSGPRRPTDAEIDAAADVALELLGAALEKCTSCGQKADHECGGCFLLCCTRKACRAKHAACATPDDLVP